MCKRFISFFLISIWHLSVSTTHAQVPLNKVVVISLDGTPSRLVNDFIDRGVLPANGAFARMKRNGAYAKTVIPVNVASTGPSHIAIFTGAPPSKSGIVGNSFRYTKDSNWSNPARSAFSEVINAETIFQAARRQGKKVIGLGAVGLDNGDSTRTADYIQAYPDIVGPSLVLDLQPANEYTSVNGKRYQKLKVSNTSPSSPFFEVFNRFKFPLFFYLTDTAISKSNVLCPLAQIVVDEDSLLTNGYLSKVLPEKWTIASVNRNQQQYHASFRILETDEVNITYRLFMSAPAEIIGAPNQFLKKLREKCGLWPGEPENRKQTTGLISEDIWFEQLDRLAKYSRDLILTAMEEQQWDMLFGYFSTLDDLQHRYTLTDRLQVDFSAEGGNRPKRYAAYVEKWFQLIDSYLLQIMEAAPKGTNFVFFSDHGMIPTHSCILLNNFFEKAGFRFSNQEIKSFSSGNSAHIYINRAKIDGTQYTNYMKRLKRILKSLKDPTTGKRVFALVADSLEQKKYDLFHSAHSGDLFVSCNVGYSISDKFLPDVNFIVKTSFDPSMFSKENEATKKFLLNGTMNETGRGIHGNLGWVKQGQPIFYAAGPNVPKKKFKKISALQISPTIAQILQIQPPKDAIGKALF